VCRFDHEAAACWGIDMYQQSGSIARSTGLSTRDVTLRADDSKEWVAAWQLAGFS